MSLTFEQANDELLHLVSTAWYPTTYRIFYESIDTEQLHDRNPFCRVWIRHASGGQRTLGGKGNRMFQRRGNLQIEVSAPVGKGLSESYQLAKVLTDAIEGHTTPGGIWFRNVRINERGSDGTYTTVAVFAEFVYDEVK